MRVLRYHPCCPARQLSAAVLPATSGCSCLQQLPSLPLRQEVLHPGGDLLSAQQVLLVHLLTGQPLRERQPAASPRSSSPLIQQPPAPFLASPALRVPTLTAAPAARGLWRGVGARGASGVDPARWRRAGGAGCRWVAAGSGACGLFTQGGGGSGFVWRRFGGEPQRDRPNVAPCLV